ncbi:hypothetical protein HPB50_008513 [Hyalomma asiaticum]|uniref:Uncharacterized protein n=1 Tax=Hyalomma asiaticum TaxID=266040 RepID=A0ACB7T1P3_HYAAI|nr:hypothetical protein HPB50_008513 [Hyalomma asiaticum]
MSLFRVPDGKPDGMVWLSGNQFGRPPGITPLRGTMVSGANFYNDTKRRATRHKRSVIWKVNKTGMAECCDRLRTLLQSFTLFCVILPVHRTQETRSRLQANLWHSPFRTTSRPDVVKRTGRKRPAPWRTTTTASEKTRRRYHSTRDEDGEVDTRHRTGTQASKRAAARSVRNSMQARKDAVLRIRNQAGKQKACTRGATLLQHGTALVRS